MEKLIIVAQVVVALGLLNVWLIRTGKPTPYRGAGAQNMSEEFAAYGLPRWFMYAVGALKVSFAVMLLAGVWYSPLAQVAAVGVAVLMIGAVAMHFKIGDPLKKSIPAASVLALAVIVAAL